LQFQLFKRFCNSGICEKTVQDIVERFWDIVEELSINRVLAVLKDNLVGAVLVVSILLWIPASCLISFVRYNFSILYHSQIMIFASNLG
jgi:hypothetical protein